MEARILCSQWEKQLRKRENRFWKFGKLVLEQVLERGYGMRDFKAGEDGGGGSGELERLMRSLSEDMSTTSSGGLEGPALFSPAWNECSPGGGAFWESLLVDYPTARPESLYIDIIQELPQWTCPQVVAATEVQSELAPSTPNSSLSEESFSDTEDHATRPLPPASSGAKRKMSDRESGNELECKKP